MNEFETVKLQISCKNIRHKLMYCDERHATRGMVDNTSDTRTFFCIKTFDNLGPDNNPVDPEECSSSRSCYCKI